MNILWLKGVEGGKEMGSGDELIPKGWKLIWGSI
jgi:hypothetical protein